MAMGQHNCTYMTQIQGFTEIQEAFLGDRRPLPNWANFSGFSGKKIFGDILADVTYLLTKVNSSYVNDIQSVLSIKFILALNSFNI